MYTDGLNTMYEFLIEHSNMPDFMDYGERLNLLPLSNINYRDKIRGTLVSLAIGDFKGNHIKTVALFAESLIIYQGFCPDDFARRLLKTTDVWRGSAVKSFCMAYKEGVLPWYRCGKESAGSGAALRCAPGALINYGDFTALKLLGGIQASITHRDQMAIASSILQSTALAYLMNTPPFSLRDQEGLLKLLDYCVKSIKGVETRVYQSRVNNEIANLYTRIQRDVREAFDKDLPLEKVMEQWGEGSYVLESIPLSLYLFLKNVNDFEKILKTNIVNRSSNDASIMALTLVGAYLGFEHIPKAYVNKLKNLEEVLALADRLFELSLKNKNNNPYRRMKEMIYEERSQDEVDQLLWLGIKHNKLEEYEGAVKYFEDLIKRNPELKKNEKIKHHIIEAYEGLGTKLLEADAFEEALKFFKKALAYDLNQPMILCDLAVAYLNLDDLEKAEKYARRAVEIFPEYDVGREVLEGIKSLRKKS